MIHVQSMDKGAGMKLFVAVLVVLVAGAAPVAGQQNGVMRGAGGQTGMPATVLLGTVVEEGTGRALPTASVEVRLARDSSLVAGALTDGAGRFRIEGVLPGRYVVRAATIGYTTVQVDEVVLGPGAVRQLDPVRLSVSAVVLQGLEVTTERSAVRMEVDRTVFNARNLPSAAGGNATDVLRNVPSVDVDVDGQVSVRGSSNVVIQVNGRTAPFRGDALGLFLKQLPAGTIDRVEVIPNPAAKYDPEGMSGIVNIVLRQNTDLGLSGALTVAGSPAERFNGSGTVGYQRGRLNLAGMYAVNSDVRRPTGFMQRLNLLGVGAGETIVQDTRSRQEALGNSLMGSIDYRVRPVLTLSLQASGNLNGNESLALNDFRLLDTSVAPGRSWASATGTERDLRAGDVTLGLRHVPEAGRREVSVEARLAATRDASEARYGDASLEALRELRRNETANRDASLQVDVTRMLAGLRVEAGARTEERVIDTDLARRPLDGGAAEARDNAFSYDTRIHAGYAQAARSWAGSACRRACGWSWRTRASSCRRWTRHTTTATAACTPARRCCTTWAVAAACARATPVACSVPGPAS
jgi:hypothetical protein